MIPYIKLNLYDIMENLDEGREYLALRRPEVLLDDPVVEWHDGSNEISELNGNYIALIKFEKE